MPAILTIDLICLPKTWKMEAIRQGQMILAVQNISRKGRLWLSIILII